MLTMVPNIPPEKVRQVSKELTNISLKVWAFIIFLSGVDVTADFAQG